MVGAGLFPGSGVSEGIGIGVLAGEDGLATALHPANTKAKIATDKYDKPLVFIGSSFPSHYF